MKLFISLTFFLCCLSAPSLRCDSTSFFTDFSFLDELNIAENLATASDAEEFKTISLLIKDFKKCTELLVEDEEDKELACELIVLAHALFHEIKSHNLNSYFSDEFLSELQFLSSIAQKNQTLSAP